jgi:hypothetical protein
VPLHFSVVCPATDNQPAFSAQTNEGEWSPPTTATTSAAIHAVAQFAAPAEGYHPYPYFYHPPPPGFMPPGPEGQPGPEGTAANASGQPPHILQYYVHPGGYPPFPHYPPPPGAAFPPPQTLDPAEAIKKADDAGGAEVTSSQVKKRAKAKGGEPKTKKPQARAQKGKKRNGVVDQAPAPGPESDNAV